MRAIQNHPILQLQVIATGMHLLQRFGRTERQISADGFRLDGCVSMQTGNDDPLDQAYGLGRGVEGIARVLQKLQSDIVLVLGDRIEAMAGALAAVTTGRQLAHIHGGDVAPGDFDESLRDSITKLADIHFPATKKSARRILAMGELRGNVFIVGAPGLDDIRALRATSGDRGVHRLRRCGEALVIQHPVGRSASLEKRTMTAILDAALAHELDCTVIFPNTDRGHAGIVAAIKEHARRNRQRIRIIRSMERGAFLQKLIDSDVLIGNSSCGIIEAPFAGTPSVNVGDRQRGRERGGGTSIIDSPESPEEIRRAIGRAIRLRPIILPRSVYGDGRTGQRIADRLGERS